jgi:hypothetical protein
MEFTKYADLVRKRFEHLAKTQQLYIVDAAKDEIFSIYLKSFPEGTNPIYKERTEHDCNTCKNFIRDVGHVVAIVDNKIQTIWDVPAEDEYKVVTEAMAEFVRTRKIVNVFLHYQNTAGATKTKQLLEDKTVKSWDHFSVAIPYTFVNKQSGAILGEKRTATEVFERGLKEITDESIDIVNELISQGSLYRGEEFARAVKDFKKLKQDYTKIKDELERNIFIWKNVHSPVSRIKNTVIGTLLSDLSEGYDLDDAVKSFESKVAPMNYKRPTALITKGMVEQAMKTVEELGIEQSLHRRFAVPEDITVNNVLFTDSKAARVVVSESLADTLLKETKATKDLSKVEEISIDKFITDILPSVNKMQVYVEGRHASNLMSLVAPTNPEAPAILKWNNNFSWSYNGEVTDSIKERVKTAGGRVDAFMRVSLSWFNYDDLDLHIKEPDGFVIHYGMKISRRTGGQLDIDMNAGSGQSREAVENTVWVDPKRVAKGWYEVSVHNFCKRENKDVGFDLQTEFNNEIKTYGYRAAVKDRHMINVLKFYFDGTSVTDVKVIADVEESGLSKEIWGINTNTFVDVSLLTLSPNHWDDQQVGNKHFFFILKDCLNPDQARGLYNEFLKGDLDKHRKVFEVIGSKLKCPASDRQLSGIGFSSTKRDTLVCKVEGKFARTLKIKF